MNFTIQRIIGIFKNLGQKYMLMDFTLILSEKIDERCEKRP